MSDFRALELASAIHTQDRPELWLDRFMADNFVGDATRSAVNSGIQSPVNGIGQLWNRTGGDLTGLEVPQLEMITPPQQAEFGSGRWYAQTVGGAAGMVVPFLLCKRAATGLTGGTRMMATRGLGEVGAARIFTSPTTRTALPFLEAGTTGAIFEGVMRPARATEGSAFWQERVTNAGIGFAVFSTLHGGTVGLKQLDQSLLSSSKPWLVNTFRHDVSRHVLSGAGAGALDANLHSMADGKGLASRSDTMKGAYTFAMLSGFMRSGGELYARKVNGTYSVSDLIDRDPAVQKVLEGSPEARTLLNDFGQVRVNTTDGSMSRLPSTTGDAAVGKTTRLVGEMAMAEARAAVLPGENWESVFAERIRQEMLADKRPFVVLFGGPASGKGTVGARLSEATGLPLLNMGNIIRWNLANVPEFAAQWAPEISRGGLLPDNVIRELFSKELEKPEYAKGAILDGVPRKLGQAEFFEQYLSERGLVVRQAVHIDAPQADLIERISERRICSNTECDSPSYHLKKAPPKKEGCCDKCGSGLIQRQDAHPDAVRVRLEDSARYTEGPLAMFYGARNRLTRVDAGNNATLDQAYAEALNASQSHTARILEAYQGSRGNSPNKNFNQDATALLRERTIMDGARQRLGGQSEYANAFDAADGSWRARWNERVAPGQTLMSRLTRRPDPQPYGGAAPADGSGGQR